MKSHLKFALASLAAFLLLTGYSVKNSSRSIEPILTTHKWTLVEVLQTVKDTVTNMTMFMLSCEKDNYMNFSSNGTYQILEGESKCNPADKDVKGEGTWRYEASDSTIVDSYEGGRKNSKRILSLNDELFKIQYEGEGRKTFTLTYFSEKGKNNALISDLAVDNSDPSQNIMQMIKQYLLSTNRYILVGKKDFETGNPSKADTKNKVLQTVALIPFDKSTPSGNTVNITERNNELIAQAKKSGTDYVISGNLLDVKASKNKKKEYDGLVKYEVYVLDVANANIQSKIFPAENEKKGEKFNWKTVGKIAGGVLGAVGAVVFYNQYSYSNWYNYYFLSNAIQRTTDVGAVFSDVNQEARQDNFDSSKALLTAISETGDDVNEFVADEMPTKIKINSIDGSGKKQQIFIEAGSNINLQKNEKLKVVKNNTKVVGDKVIPAFEDLGSISVKEIVADVLSSCSFEKGMDKIIEAHKQNPNDVFVVTTVKILPKEKK